MHALKQSSNHFREPVTPLSVIVFLAPTFFLVVKGWVNASLFLLFFVSLWFIFKEPNKFLSNRGPQFWTIFVSILAPFIAELLTQLGREGFVASSLDGPSRAILAAILFVYLSKRDSENLLSSLVLGSAVGVVIVFAYLQIFPSHYWGGRAATYFVDPITLPCYTVGLAGIFLFGNTPYLPNRVGLFARLLVVLITIYIAAESQSRSSWLAGIVLVEAYLLYSLRKSLLNQVIATLLLALGLLGIFIFSETVYSRVMESFEGFMAFMKQDGGQSSSTGQRLVLLLIDIELLKNNLLFGTTDTTIPPYEHLKSLIPSLTREIYEIKILAGSHSEFLGQVVGKGVVFGGFALWGLIFYPLYLIIFRLRAEGLLDCGLGSLFGLLVPVVVSGFTIQMFNLKMTISFYMLSLAISLAHYHRTCLISKSGAEG
ncbi:hypothetical protein N9E22_01590 [Burkholderiales bacterium]|nr:hypothetical protein [Burkholderiales bacterium]